MPSSDCVGTSHSPPFTSSTVHCRHALPPYSWRVSPPEEWLTSLHSSHLIQARYSEKKIDPNTNFFILICVFFYEDFSLPGFFSILHFQFRYVILKYRGFKNVACLQICVTGARHKIWRIAYPEDMHRASFYKRGQVMLPPKAAREKEIQ
jgi:hypothetical protein